MGLLKDLTTETISELTGITQDASYQGDPNGTPANKAFFEGNVHSYLKDLGLATSPSNTYQVSPAFAGLGNPFFETVSAAHAQVVTDGSSASNKKVIDINAKGDSYSQPLTLNHNGFVLLRGRGRGTTLSGSLTISAGVYLFENLLITGNITISVGTVVFKNCEITGTVSITSNTASKVIIMDALHVGVITIDGNNKTFLLQNIANMSKDGNDHSVNISAGLTGGIYELRAVFMTGELDDLTSEAKVSLVEQNTTSITI